jgi:hypothetical protein
VTSMLSHASDSVAESCWLSCYEMLNHAGDSDAESCW